MVCDYIAQLGVLIREGPALAVVKRDLLQHGLCTVILYRYLHSGGRIDQKRPISHQNGLKPTHLLLMCDVLCVRVYFLKCNRCDLNFEVSQSEEAHEDKS